MSKVYFEFGKYSMVTDYLGREVFNDDDEEDRYQAFKRRLIEELKDEHKGAFLYLAGVVSKDDLAPDEKGE